MRAFANGATTSGSSFPRDEFREMQNHGRDNASWRIGDGEHTLSGTLLVTHHIPDEKACVVAQIHDAEDDVVMLRVTKTSDKTARIDAEFSKGKGNGSTKVPLAASYRFGTRFDYKIVAHETGLIEVSYKLNTTSKWTTIKKQILKRSKCYFKAGVYAQFNDDTASRWALACSVYYKLEVTHE
jgi:hypothetical protein